MRRIYQAAGISEERLAHARAAMARQLRVECDAFIDDALRRTMTIPGYERLDVERVRPNTRRSILAILATLEGGELQLFGQVLYDIAYTRAKQGLPPRTLFQLADITEAMLFELGQRCSLDAAGLVSAGILAREIADGSREVIIDAFQKAYLEMRADAEHLASQFSAPILPALPGVLVLPIVGEVTQVRADQIVAALLEGVVGHAARLAILDMTGITNVGASLATHLRRAAHATRLVGANIALVGVNPSVARMLVDNDVDLSGVRIYATLAAALITMTSHEMDESTNRASE